MRLVDELARRRPDVVDPARRIAAGEVTVGGRVLSNPDAFVRQDDAIVVRTLVPLRGEAKLRAALEAFGVAVAGRVALDVGAAAGGFTRTLLDAGAARVYAVDVGHGQLVGSLRQDPRVRALESTNVADLDPGLVPDVVDVVTVDVSYLSLASAVAQLDRMELADDADLVGLVKPMFELRLPAAPADRDALDEALARAVAGIEAAGWTVCGWIESPVTGARGAPERLVHARRRGAVS